MIGSHSERVHDSEELGILTYMALGELDAYRAFAKIMSENQELSIAKLFGHTARQESIHLGYQSTRAIELAATMKDSHVERVGDIIEKIYWPVGTTKDDVIRKKAIGHMMRTVCDDDGEALAMGAAKLAHSILPSMSATSPFLLNRYSECLAA